MTEQPAIGTPFEVFRAFLKLGLISFGGPIAHLGYFHEEFVRKRSWITDEAYADLVALCQFLPGPASSQVVFALGKMRAGIRGAFAASFAFTMPSALLMIAFAYGVGSAGLARAGFLSGLKLAAVAVVAHAVWTMGKKLCPDVPRFSIAAITALALVFFPNAVLQLALIACGGLAGIKIYGAASLPAAQRDGGQHASGIRGAVWALGLFFSLLIALPALRVGTELRMLKEFDSFYRAGSLVFGGGHVVLPLLRAEVVPPGWVSDDAFLAGYGAAQALPGPLFTFSAYLGTVMHASSRAWVGGLWCLLAIFLPAWLLIGAALPFWQRLKAKAWAQGALMGANAAVVGILAAAFYDPVCKGTIRAIGDAVLALVAFALLQRWRWPSWVVVAGLAAIAQLLY